MSIFSNLSITMYLLKRLSGLSFCLFAAISCAEPDILVAESQQAYELKKVSEAVQVPWSMTWLSDKEALVTDRQGQLRLMRDEVILAEPIAGVPEVNAKNQGGLLDVVLDPDYAVNGWIYLSYSGLEGEGEGSHTSIMRAKLKDMRLVDQELLFDGGPNSDKNHHYGSRMAFDAAGYLYFSIGDRGERDNFPQRLGADAGKVHRIHPDGRIPKDNPFVSNPDATASVYSYGHRNPQGMAVHPLTGKIWAHEHGPRGGDEINIIQAGTNYGWPVITYGINYSGTKITDLTHKDGMQQPIWQWTPSIAPSDMLFVTSDKYPDWKGHMLVGSLKFAYLVLVQLEGEKVLGHTKLFEGVGRLRSISQSPDGDIYIGTDGNGIFKVVAKS